MTNCETEIVQTGIRTSMDSLRILHDVSPASAIDIRPTATTSPCMSRNKPAISFSGESDKHFQGRKASNTYPGREIDWQRHALTVLSSDLGRRADDGSDLGSQSLPPLLSPSSRAAHNQHLRVYGRSCDVDNQAKEDDQAGEVFVQVIAPTEPTIWTRGKPALIQWQVEDSSVEHVQIDLLEHGTSATTIIAKEAPNTGEFSYPKVPWGMASGDKYYLRISSSNDPTRYLTTGFFTIGSAP